MYLSLDSPISRPWEKASEHVVYLDVRGVEKWDREEGEKASIKGF